MLTSKQRAYLRSLANGIDAIFQVGKNGVTPEYRARGARSQRIGQNQCVRQQHARCGTGSGNAC